MANDNNIKNFTASDIEKYHRGQLSAKEMHDLEKAALDDPFLADALEGYAVTGINVNADIAELKKRLAEKTEQAKVIPMQQGGSSSFPWLRAAVMVLLIAGAGTLAYQLLFKSNSKENPIAKTPAAEKSNSTEPAKISPQLKRNDTSLNLNYIATEKASQSKASTEYQVKQQPDVVTNLVTDRPDKDSVTSYWKGTVTDAVTTNTTPPVKTIEEKADYKTDDIIRRNFYDSTGKIDIGAKNLALSKKTADKEAESFGYFEKAKGEVVSNGAVNRRNDNNLYRNTNVFNGRVTDANNNALPFANVTNSRDNVGTYSDAQGNFTLVSTDTVLDVQVRSLGFQNRNIQLRNFNGLKTDNRVMLQEDRSLPVDTIDKVKRNIKPRPNNTMTFEEPEPEDGWDSYGSYVVNNLNIPETFERKKAGETADNTVEVSFEVNKNGEPVNIRVEKSLCDKCDVEAKRLIKEGPKWKRKAKKSKRITVTVPFIKPE